VFTTLTYIEDQWPGSRYHNQYFQAPYSKGRQFDHLNAMWSSLVFAAALFSGLGEAAPATTNLESRKKPRPDSNVQVLPDLISDNDGVPVEVNVTRPS
jgi:hypothetical protein